MATTKIKDPVEGMIDLDRLPGVQVEHVRRLVDAPELQRLRGIKQLGFSELVYPGATHTRFAHSLGSFQGAQRTMLQLRASGVDIPDQWLVATALACLLHDVGHGPFSHTFEAVTGHRHEDWTAELILRGPQVPEILEDMETGTRARVLELLSGHVPEPGLRFLADLVSSALDCDRMDYLRRDALHTGTLYGSFDRDWLVRGMTRSADGDAIVVVEKARSAVEQYLIGRYHMFQNVYLHKTSRGFETAFRGLCRRLQTLGADVVPPTCRAMDVLFEDEISVERYLELTDHHFHVDFDQLIDHEDRTVRSLARALLWRRPLSCLSTDHVDLGDFEGELQRRKEDAAKNGLDPECAVWSDQARDVPHRPYSPQEGRKGLRMQLGSGELVDITELSPTLNALTAPVVIRRLYWVDPD